MSKTNTPPIHRSALDFPLPPIVHATSLIDQDRAERKGRRDWRVSFDENGMCPHIETLYGAFAQKAMRASQDLHDCVAAIDKRVGTYKQELLLLESREDVGENRHLHPGASHYEQAQAKRAERQRAAQEAANTATIQSVHKAIDELLQQRRHVHGQARDCVAQLSANFHTLVAAYRQGVESGPWWRRLFKPRRTISEPIPRFEPNVEWAESDLPIMEVQIDTTTSPEVSWQYRPLNLN